MRRKILFKGEKENIWKREINFIARGMKAEKEKEDKYLEKENTFFSEEKKSGE